jgi:hypothetical protein
MSTDWNCGSSFRGWMQSTGQTSTHAVSFVPTQGSQMIYATTAVSPDGMSSTPRSIPRRFRAALGAVTALLGLAVAPRAQVQEVPPTPGIAWRAAPEYVTLFAPRLHREAYRAFVVPDGLPSVLPLIAADPGSLQAPGSWMPREQLPSDAFGEGGGYDRRRIARLYGSRRATVVRGPHGHDGAVEEMWTLVSPFPSPALDRLDAGTLLIILRVP